METLEKSRVCRLCGRQAGISIDIFEKRGNHVKKINMVLPILVHELDLLPKHMCHPCNYKLQEFHKFYEDCLKTDANLKSQLSWMQGSEIREEIIIPMVQINNVKIKTEPAPLAHEDREITMSTILGNDKINHYENHYTFNDKFVPFIGSRCSRCGCYCGNRNYRNEEASECPRMSKHKGESEKNIDSPSRDVIPRRNLFATEIFGTKNVRAQREISIFAETELFKGVPSQNSGQLRSSIVQQDGVVKTEMADVPVIFSPRNLRPRNKLTTGIFKSKSSKNSNKPTITLSQEAISKESVGVVNNSGVVVNTKIEMEMIDRISLRPRTEPINYSESKRKRINVASIIPGIKKANCQLRVKKEIKSSLMDPTPTIVKPELEDDLSCFGRRIRETKKYRVKKEIVKTEFSEQNENNLYGSTSRDKLTERKRKKLPKYFHNSTNLCLRSQIGYLRNGKLMKFHLDVDGLNRKKFLQSAPLKSNRRKKFKDETKNFSTTATKLYDCSVCENRFVSHELYRLHGCYNNRRH